jgi:hypothetical protein
MSDANKALAAATQQAAETARLLHDHDGQKAGMHVDEWLDQGAYEVVKNPETAYARFVLDMFRLPAWKNAAYAPWLNQYKLFCTYTDGKRYRCTGASRMGDVWLATDFQRDAGYDLRVDVTNCTDWSAQP